MKVTELRTKSLAELENLLISLSQERFNLKMQKATGQMSRPDQLKAIRRNMARIHTVIAEK